MNIDSLFNLAGPDLFVILIIVLLLFGAKNLPELAGRMGDAIRELNRLLVPIAIIIILLACAVWVSRL